MKRRLHSHSSSSEGELSDQIHQTNRMTLSDTKKKDAKKIVRMTDPRIPSGFHILSCTIRDPSSGAIIHELPDREISINKKTRRMTSPTPTPNISSPRRVNPNLDPHVVCIICEKNLNIKPINLLTCGHRFHMSCIHDVFEFGPNDVCPVCEQYSEIQHHNSNYCVICKRKPQKSRPLTVRRARQPSSSSTSSSSQGSKTKKTKKNKRTFKDDILQKRFNSMTLEF